LAALLTAQTLLKTQRYRHIVALNSGAVERTYSLALQYLKTKLPIWLRVDQTTIAAALLKNATSLFYG